MAYSQIQWDWIRDKICNSHKSPVPLYCHKSTSIPYPEKPITLNCPSNKVLFQLLLVPDENPNDITWFLYERSKGRLRSRRYRIIKRGTGSDFVQEHHYQQCIKKDKKFMFVIKDTSGNGLCCSSGQGYYKLVVDGESFTPL